MATYKGIQGFGVETLASDPTEPGSVGQIFYNSTSGTFKTVKPGGLPAGTWASGGDLNTARSTMASAGFNKRTERRSRLTNCVYYFGGISPHNHLLYTNTESWDGTNWTEVGELNTAKIRYVRFWNCKLLRLVEVDIHSCCYNYRNLEWNILDRS
jgi:hypothetical protein